MLSQAFKVARMDFNWGSIESTCGQYNFAAYDNLLQVMAANNVRPYWIMDYGNACYPAAPGQPSVSCSTPACITAFGNFAAAAVAHFKGHGIQWECLNEPNGMGGDNATDIAAVCLSAGAHILAAGESFVGPATSGIDFPYLGTAFKAGILAAFTGVSVHPYRSDAPETVLPDYVTLRALIAQYAAPGHTYPVLSGEWGYTSALPPCVYGNRVDEPTQGKYAVRMLLVNSLAGIQTSIVYDWRDDGNDTTNCEDNFGSVHSTATGNPAQPFAPKPYYTAVASAQATVGNAVAFGSRLQPLSVVPSVGPEGGSPGPYDIFLLSFTGTPGAPAGLSFALWSNATFCAATTPETRFSCGLVVSEEECSAKACCWDDSLPLVKCYRGQGVAPVTTSFNTGAPGGSCWSATLWTGAANGTVCADGSGVVSVPLTDGPTFLA